MCTLMAKGIVTIFGQHGPWTHNTVKTFSEAFHMPYVTTSIPMNLTSRSNGYMLYMRPLYNKAIIHVIQYYGADKVYYIYHNDEGLLRLEQLLNEILKENVKLQVKVYKVNNLTHAQKTTMDIPNKDDLTKGMKVLLDMPGNMCQEYLLSEMPDLWQFQFHFFVIGLAKFAVRLNNTKVIILDMDNFVSNSFEEALAVDSANLITHALGIVYANMPNPKFSFDNGTGGIDCDSEIPIPWAYGPIIIKVMKETKMDGLTGKIAFDDHGFRKGYKLNVMETNPHGGLSKVGTWTPEEKFIVHETGRTRIVTSILTEPFLMPRTHSSNDGKPLVGNDRFEGYCADLVKEVANRVGMQYVIVPVKDGKYGAMERNNRTWNGMVGELIHNEADLSVAPLAITSRRLQFIHFSEPFKEFGISLMLKRPSESSPELFSFTYPFSFGVWMCLIFAYFGVSVVLFFVSYASALKRHDKGTDDEPVLTDKFNILNSLWFTFAAFMQHGCDFEPRSLTGRIVCTAWWFFTLIIMSTYTAKLAAVLTLTRMKVPVNSVEDLAKQNAINYGCVKNGATQAFFEQRTTDPTYLKMWAFMSGNPMVFVRSNEDGVQRVREARGRYGFLLDSTLNDYVNQRMPCDTVRVGDIVDPKGFGIGIPFNSDLRENVSLAILEMKETGMLLALEKKWWYDRGDCTHLPHTLKQEDPQATSTLDLTKIVGILYVLVSGLIFAGVVVVFEVLCQSRLKASKRKKYAQLSLEAPEDEAIILEDYSEDIPEQLAQCTHTQV